MQFLANALADLGYSIVRNPINNRHEVSPVVNNRDFNEFMKAIGGTPLYEDKGLYIQLDDDKVACAYFKCSHDDEEFEFRYDPAVMDLTPV